MYIVIVIVGTIIYTNCVWNSNSNCNTNLNLINH